MQTLSGSADQRGALLAPVYSSSLVRRASLCCSRATGQAKATLWFRQPPRLSRVRLNRVRLNRLRLNRTPPLRSRALLSRACWAAAPQESFARYRLGDDWAEAPGSDRG